VRFGHCCVGDFAVAGVDAASESRLPFAGAFQPELGEQFHITRRRVAERLVEVRAYAPGMFATQ
jgi:hypothetical protein